MELEKLTLSKKTFHKIHIGKHHRKFSELFVHGAVMSESKAEKYLCDIVHNSGSIKPNLARRLSRGWGKLSEILAMVKEATGKTRDNVMTHIKKTPALKYIAL